MNYLEEMPAMPPFGIAFRKRRLWGGNKFDPIRLPIHIYRAIFVGMKTKEKQKGAEKTMSDGKTKSKDEFVKAVRAAEKGPFYSVEESKKLVGKDIALTLAQEEEVEKRVMRHQNGDSKSYSWSEVKNRAKAGS